MHNFKKLNIWIDGMEIVSETYKLTKTFPDNEKFGLTSQMNRCAVSIPSNIAEGTSKSSDKHFNKYLEDSLGSAFELETQLIIAYREKYLTEEKYNILIKKINQLQKMISGFKSRLSKSLDS
ncbi:four helix bundle protein [Kordia sp. SMS9]|uniref:four helix bundle protein n=1 Tax=Kordia sp. SMS9 TaxID=2282170 RepID=UPI001F07EFCC|nr:four helix bundle protein [Kordia sp. SMS9]